MKAYLVFFALVGPADGTAVLHEQYGIQEPTMDLCNDLLRTMALPAGQIARCQSKKPRRVMN